MSDTWARVGASDLALPEPPASLATDVRALGDERWGTREGAPGLRGLSTFANEARAGVSDYVLAGIEEASTAQPALHYALVYGRIGLFVQVPLAAAPDRMALVGRVQVAAVRAAVQGELPEEGKLIVIDTPFGLHHWEWTPEVEGNSDGLEGAEAWLAARAGSERV